MQRETHVPLDIEDGIPLPEARHASRGRSKYPLKEMKVGQSFFIKTTNPGSARNTVVKSAITLKVSIDARIVTEKVNGIDTKGVRVWRVADRFQPGDVKPGRGSKK